MDTDLEPFWRQPRIQRDLQALITTALREDGVDDDAASRLAFGDGQIPARARITAEESGVVCGVLPTLHVFERLDPALNVIQRASEGQGVAAGDVVLELDATISAVLGAERTALNLLGYLSGISTRTAHWVSLAPDVTVLDTRKTLPGWRDFAKYAVRAGGGTNHRRDLAEFPMLKENHRQLFRKNCLSDTATPEEEIEALVVRHRESAYSQRPLEIEVEDYESLRACVERDVDWILIDNQTPDRIREWVAKLESTLDLPDGWRSRLEASGGVTGETIRDYAAAGVGRISVGSLTHSVPALDVSLHVEWVE